ncbi:MAG: iron-sulfur cluster assembly accessory protein [Balneola sp.]|jgi:iron-sulfur cluster assembly protein|nr:iron-sulfur cluster assembly accessory protein [Balneola sp.]MBO6621130.1 iron-sulfur cluster assembly accessory protein [Balneola sp.]MBO6650197.1 iron-sulfur cluster assembly accessory protein [Balneola sp.]MBO6710561.1 iron-sulfur cluster assembly accessory protein [Balneola sp.]MBO6799247.1 iron-sulfur cluster assembly accessory protein [Balneola sp.]|tara:strand:- start:21260 stop:21595 length:336 start_codon:yes stop_codon:yes gene_type:complete
MDISISDRAIKRIDEIRTEQNVPKDAFLKVGVVSGGCSGLTYDLDFDSDVEPQENDKVFELNGMKVLVDMRSFLYLAGTELDYTDGLEGEGFHFHNPNASRTCSCGESFSI